MAFKPIDWMFGAQSMRKQRDQAIRMAGELYNPNAMNPALDEARQAASEGIDDATIRAATSARIYQGSPQRTAAAYGGNATAFVTGQLASDASRAQTLGMAELDIASREEEAKRLGRMSMAEILVKQNEVAAQRGASVRGAKMQYDAAVQQGRLGVAKGLLETGLAVASIAAMGGAFAPSPVAPGGSAATKVAAGTAKSNTNAPPVTTPVKPVSFGDTFVPSGIAAGAAARGATAGSATKGVVTMYGEFVKAQRNGYPGTFTQWMTENG